VQATILLHGDCPVCGYRNCGVKVGSVRPGMKQMTMLPRSIGFTPPRCRECNHPVGHDLYDRWVLDADTTAKLKAWQQRQRDRRTQRKAS
jgi:hypothetical protein